MSRVKCSSVMSSPGVTPASSSNTDTQQRNWTRVTSIFSMEKCMSTKTTRTPCPVCLSVRLSVPLSIGAGQEDTQPKWSQDNSINRYLLGSPFISKAFPLLLWCETDVKTAQLIFSLVVPSSSYCCLLGSLSLSLSTKFTVFTVEATIIACFCFVFLSSACSVWFLFKSAPRSLTNLPFKNLNKHETVLRKINLEQIGVSLPLVLC